MKCILPTKEQIQCIQSILMLSLQNGGLGVDSIYTCIFCDLYSAAHVLIYKNLYFHFFWKLRRFGIIRYILVYGNPLEPSSTYNFRLGGISLPSLVWTL